MFILILIIVIIIIFLISSLFSFQIRDNIGYPVAECAADGKFILSKPPNTGGLVSPSSVSEQVTSSPAYNNNNNKLYWLVKTSTQYLKAAVTFKLFESNPRKKEKILIFYKSYRSVQ